MDHILKTFSIGFLLRSVFSGIFFVISFHAASHPSMELAKLDSAITLSIVLSVALFAGVTAYGIHRSLLYPCVEYCFDSDWGRAWRKRIPLIRNSTICTLLWRWDSGAQDSEDNRKLINEHLNEWGDIIHLQYVSALCIALGAVTGAIVVPGKYLPYCPLIGLASVLFMAAIVSNWRHHSLIDYVRNAPSTSPNEI